MKTAFLYLGFAVIGYLVAGLLQKLNCSMKWVSAALATDVTALILLMGFRIGSNIEVVSNLGTIGFSSLAMALFSMAVCVLLLHLLRKAMRLDHTGQKRGSGDVPITESENGDKEEGPLIPSSTIRYLIAVIAGFAAGYLLVIRTEIWDFEAAASLTGHLVSIGLYLLVFLVGIDLGISGELASAYRKISWSILLYPLVTAIGTIISIGVCGMVLSFSLKETLGIACTFGWYSFGPNVMLASGLITASAYCFLTNFFRDMLSFLLIPIVAKRVGYLETICMPQAASMDLCISTISGCTNAATTLCSFVSGVLFTAVVPVIMPVIMAL